MKVVFPVIILYFGGLKMDGNRKNMACVMTGVRTMEIREIEMPVCGDDDVLIKTEYVGLCGSDVHFFEEGRIGITGAQTGLPS